MICAGRDWIVRLEAQRRFFERLSSPVKEIESYPQARHAIFHDDDRAAVCNRIRQFVNERFSTPVSQSSLLDADRFGHTRAEFDRLNSGGGVRFAIARAGLRAAGHFSRGINIGWRSGFDSGLSLDYVYENKPTGRTPLGQFIDRTYLNSPGWRGVRQRKSHLKKILTNTIERLHDEHRPIRILDIAAGAGRYLLETISEMLHLPITATLRDYKRENVAAAASLAQELGLTSITACEGDAFDAESIAKTCPRPTIGVVSGLYELFPSNEAVRRSLDGLARAIEPGGYLVYTNQPWHPQIEFIARVLKNREGKPWVMRRRTTAEIDQLVAAAGFTKLSMEVDQWGMFTVSLARRE
jgi:SAM-dependent methyltransferase